MFIRAAAAFLCLAAAIGGASAQDASGCEKFKWSIARERAWFAASPKPVDASAEVSVGDVGYVVALVASDAAGFVTPPERAPKAGTFGAVLKSAIGKPGLYQITLSDEAWIDVVQNGASVKSSNFSGQKACPGVRKSVRFDLATGPATVQISNAESPKITLAIAPAE
jgi:hypothetical protein